MMDSSYQLIRTAEFPLRPRLLVPNSLDAPFVDRAPLPNPNHAGTHRPGTCGGNR